MTSFHGAYHGKRVLVTGHSGFKGSWLCEWLLALGAHVTGFGLPPLTEPALFQQLQLADRLDQVLGDVRSLDGVRRVVLEAQPDFVFQLAGQPLARRSYREPVVTWQTNVNGTVNLLEALRLLKKPCATVLLTSDRCYEERDTYYAYREGDCLGGLDPLGSGAAAAEVAIAAWRSSFFSEGTVRIASCRAGNMIAGGDWSQERLMPECVRSWLAGSQVHIKTPDATRAWQHVLEPLSGCLWLGAQLSRLPGPDSPLCSAFNFGPGPDGTRTVRQLVTEAGQLFDGEWVEAPGSSDPVRNPQFPLAIDKAAMLLGWRPVWSFNDAVRETVRWYFDLAHRNDDGMASRITRDQIEAYVGRAQELGLSWATHAAPGAAR